LTMRGVAQAQGVMLRLIIRIRVPTQQRARQKCRAGIAPTSSKTSPTVCKALQERDALRRRSCSKKLRDKRNSGPISQTNRVVLGTSPDSSSGHCSPPHRSDPKLAGCPPRWSFFHPVQTLRGVLRYCLLRTCRGLGFFSIQEKALFDTRYHYISLHITLLSLCIIVYHCRYHNISCPSATHDISVYHLFFFCF